MDEARKVTLELDYGKREILNLRKVWVEPARRRQGFMLCYADDLYSKGILYHSISQRFLEHLKNSLTEEYHEGKNIIKL